MLFAHLIYVLANYIAALCPAGRRVPTECHTWVEIWSLLSFVQKERILQWIVIYNTPVEAAQMKCL